MKNQLLLGAPVEPHLLPPPPAPGETRPPAAFAYPRDFLDNRFVYLTVSPRARGLSIGVNINPDQKCNFDCVYCEVDRAGDATRPEFDCDAAAVELTETLRLVTSGELLRRPPYHSLPKELTKLRHVALSGDGEPTISPVFRAAVEMAVHVRARGGFPFFKIVLITNASALDLPEAQAALSLFTPRDEIWAKLDVGSQRSMDLINLPSVPYQKIVQNILSVARLRPVIIQSLFCQVDGAVPSAAEIEAFAAQLRALKEQGAQIPLVQIYSATRPAFRPNVRHLPLKTLSDIAERVRKSAGLNAEPF